VSDAALVACLALLGAATAAADELPPPGDPMRPFVVAGQSAAPGAARRPYELTAVVISSARRIAVVNGRPYQLGERIGAAEIVGIDRQAVHLRVKGETVVVPLGRATPIVRVPAGEGEETQ
jgi:hypothetical protein